ncbi:MAG: hypothetical protein IT180_02905 [Acidobacteria bacterium]|jgi:hypothetical protein|nr:hypothetical protein [Acidobacteriota bacterium]
MMRSLAAMAVCAVLASTITVLAHPGHTHKILGTVTAVTAASVEVLDRGNEKTTFAITKDTKIRVGKGAGTIKDVRTGLRIVVEAEEGEDETFVALTIQLPERPAQEEAR